jgi:hypothetical protein
VTLARSRRARERSARLTARTGARCVLRFAIGVVSAVSALQHLRINQNGFGQIFELHLQLVNLYEYLQFIHVF